MTNASSPINVLVTNNPKASPDTTHVAIAIRAGYALKEYEVDAERNYAANLGTFSVLCNHLRSKPSCQGISFAVEPSVTFACFEAPARAVPAVIGHVLNEMRTPLTAEEFDAAKALTHEQFKKVYAKGEFRARLLALEYLRMPEGFSRKLLTEDVKNVTLEMLNRDVKLLMTTGNISICCIGEADPDRIRQFCETVPAEPELTYAAANIYNLARPNMHVEALARTTTGSRVLAFTCANAETNQACRRLMLDITIEQMGLEHFETQFDHYVAGVITIGEPRTSLQSLVPDNPLPTFEHARDRVVARYLSAFERNPRGTALLAAEMLLCGINLFTYLDLMRELDVDSYKEILDTAQPATSEGQALLSRNAQADEPANGKEA